MNMILLFIFIGLQVAFWCDILSWLFPYASSQIEWIVNILGALVVIYKLPDYE